MYVDILVSATRYERSKRCATQRNEGRATQRNGIRERDLETRFGTLDLKIPKVRQGS